jgi:hypothetical protein
MERSRVGVALGRIARGKRVARAIVRACGACGSDVKMPRAVAGRIQMCASPANHWTGDVFINPETGETEEGNGTLWSCASRLCQSCVSKMAARSRGELRVAVGYYKLNPRERYYFLTFTAPARVERLTLKQSRAVIVRAWQLLRRRGEWRQVEGGAKSEEFTLRAWGHHYHIHVLGVSRWIVTKTLRAAWTECLMKAYGEAGLAWRCGTSDGLARVHVELVTPRDVKTRRSKGAGDIGLRGLNSAILESAKYLTKSDSWEKLDAGDLVETAAVERWGRMFELFGCLRDARKAAREATKQETQASSSYVHTTEIKDGELSVASGTDPPKEMVKERRRTWRDELRERNIDEWRSWQLMKVKQTIEARRSVLWLKYPHATFYDLNGEGWDRLNAQQSHRIT